MNKHVSIVADVDADTLAIVNRVAHRRGISSQQFAAEAIRRAAESDDDFDAFLQKGEDDFARGDFVEHDVLVANLRRWRETRIRPS